MQKIIELINVSKSFDGEKVLDNINLHIYDNEFLTLLGPSGCGKSTFLKTLESNLESKIQSQEKSFLGTDASKMQTMTGKK